MNKWDKMPFYSNNLFLHNPISGETENRTPSVMLQESIWAVILHKCGIVPKNWYVKIFTD